MTISDWVMVLAVLLAPLVAVQVSKRLDIRREVRGRKLAVFRALMTTRATKLGTAHVEALNMIDVEFHGEGSDDKVVRNAWKQYLDHLNRYSDSEAWGAKADDLFVELLHNMGRGLGYDFDKVHIKNQSYWPQAHGNLEWEQQLYRRGVIELLHGKRSLPVHAVERQATQDIQAPDARAGTLQKTSADESDLWRRRAGVARSGTPARDARSATPGNLLESVLLTLARSIRGHIALIGSQRTH